MTDTYQESQISMLKSRLEETIQELARINVRLKEVKGHLETGDFEKVDKLLASLEGEVETWRTDKFGMFHTSFVTSFLWAVLEGEEASH